MKRCNVSRDYHNGLSLLRGRNYFNDFFDNFLSNSMFDEYKDVNQVISPKINFLENDNEYIVEAELPGVSKDDIELICSDDILTIKAKRSNNQEEIGNNYCKIESFFGEIQRQINVPTNIKREKIDAKYENGILFVTLPKSNNNKSNLKINIK